MQERIVQVHGVGLDPPVEAGTPLLRAPRLLTVSKAAAKP